MYVPVRPPKTLEPGSRCSLPGIRKDPEQAPPEHNGFKPPSSPAAACDTGEPGFFPASSFQADTPHANPTAACTVRGQRPGPVPPGRNPPRMDSLPPVQRKPEVPSVRIRCHCFCLSEAEPPALVLFRIGVCSPGLLRSAGAMPCHHMVHVASRPRRIHGARAPPVPPAMDSVPWARKIGLHLPAAFPVRPVGPRRAHLSPPSGASVLPDLPWCGQIPAPLKQNLKSIMKGEKP